MKHDQPIAVVPDEAGMLLCHQPRQQSPLQLQTHLLQIHVGVGKGYDVVPVSGEEVDLESLLQEGGQQGDAAFGLALVLIVDVHIAHRYVLLFHRIERLIVDV